MSLISIRQKCVTCTELNGKKYDVWSDEALLVANPVPNLYIDDELVIFGNLLISKSNDEGEMVGLDNSRSVDGEYTLAKLMEHSWWLNPFVNSFSKQIYNSKSRVCWVGDYADEPADFKFANNSAFYVPNYKEVWRNKVELLKLHSTDFTLDGNDTNEYIDLYEYKKQSEGKNGWTIHPLPLLTAVGNDRGGGDFHEGNIGYEFVGIWAWQLISISDSFPKNFTQVNIILKEK